MWQGAVGLGADGAALAGRRADCVRRECTHAEVASCGKVCVRMERRGVGEACGDEEPTDEAFGAYRRGVERRRLQNGAKVSRGVRKLASAEGARARGGSSLPRVGAHCTLDVECPRGNEYEAATVSMDIQHGNQ